jgi:uncharacterized membrane protein YozB (DUF420 family)
MSDPQPALLHAAAGQGGDLLLLAAHAHPLVHLNAALNALATVLLVLGHREIKRGNEPAHGRLMLAALATSAAFLTSYLIYHLGVRKTVHFTHPGVVRYVYYAILLSHVLLAFTVPFLAIAAAFFGVRALGWRAGSSPSPAPPLDQPASLAARQTHRKIVAWAYPIWLYVSITGVIVYAMVYHLWPSVEL